MSSAPSRDPHDPLRIVVAGGGVAALEAALTLAELAREKIDVTLVADQDEFVFRAQAVGEPFGLGRSRRLPLRDVARDTGATFRRGRVTGVDAPSRQVLLHGEEPLSYDALLLALGARSVPAYPAAMTWRDNDAEALAGLVRDVEEGYSRSVAFLVPPGPVWPLPAYELALLLARSASGMAAETNIALVTSEDQPLAAFGPTASAAVARELERAGVRVETGVDADLQRGHRTTIRLRPSDRTLEVDRVVALPRVEGRRLDGVPADDEGFILVDDHCAVRGLDRVWAAGDGIAFAVKHGGLAAQQADVAAAAIAALAGADVEVEPFRPVLRGVLLTHAGSRAMTYDPAAEKGETSTGALWWPPGKVAGDRLAAYLAEHGAGLGMPERLAGARVEHVVEAKPPAA